jgi:zinc transporter
VWLTSQPHFGLVVREELFSSDDHQQLRMPDQQSLLGSLVDNVRHLDGATGEIGHWRFVMNDRIVVSGGRDALSAVEALRTAVQQGRPLPEPVNLLEAVLDQMMSDLDRTMRGLSTAFDEVEDRVLADPVRDERKHLGRLRRRAVAVHRRLAGLLSLFRRLELESDGQMAPMLRAMISRVAPRLATLDHEAAATQERGRFLQDEIAAKLATEANRHLHALSILTSIFLPPTLIVGTFGMNIDNLPLIHSNWAFLWIILISMLSGIAALLVLRRATDWLRRSGLLR